MNYYITRRLITPLAPCISLAGLAVIASSCCKQFFFCAIKRAHGTDKSRRPDTRLCLLHLIAMRIENESSTVDRTHSNSTFAGRLAGDVRDSNWKNEKSTKRAKSERPVVEITSELIREDKTFLTSIMTFFTRRRSRRSEGDVYPESISWNSCSSKF